MPGSHQNISKPNLTDTEREGVVLFLLQRYSGGKLENGAISAAAEKILVSRKTIGTIWKIAKQNIGSGAISVDVRSKIKQNSGRKQKDRKPILDKIAAVPLRLRTTLRGLSAAENEPMTTLHRIFKEGKLKRISNTLKPRLKAENKLARILFALSFVDQNSFKFSAMFDRVHVEEKWLYMTKNKQNYYQLCDEEQVIRTVQSKRFITKVMFIAAVARPRWDPNRKTMFDGKLGIWPFVKQVPAIRDSKNRPKGTLVTKPIDAVNKEEYKKALIEQIIPVIKEKWPKSHKNMKIIIQQDNAKPHVSPDAPDVVQAGTADGWDISLSFQPANSPDLNVLDLGFFASIQSLQYKEAPSTIDELVAAVVKAFNDESVECLDNVFLSLQAVMECIMNSHGGNDFKLPHLGKTSLRRGENLPTSLTCSLESIDSALGSILELNYN